MARSARCKWGLGLLQLRTKDNVCDQIQTRFRAYGRTFRTKLGSILLCHREMVGPTQGADRLAVSAVWIRFLSSIDSRVLGLVCIAHLFRRGIEPMAPVVEEATYFRGHLLLEKTIVVREYLHGAFFALCQTLGMILDCEVLIYFFFRCSHPGGPQDAFAEQTRRLASWKAAGKCSEAVILLGICHGVDVTGNSLVRREAGPCADASGLWEAGRSDEPPKKHSALQTEAVGVSDEVGKEDRWQ